MFNWKKRLNDTLNIDNQTIEIYSDLGGTPLIILIVFGETCTATIVTLGNFSMIVGKVKSPKTFCVSIAVAAAV